MSRAFVTGGTGLVGIRLLLDLLRSGRSVKALVRAGSDTRHVQRLLETLEPGSNHFERIEWVEGDILDPWALENGMRDCSEVYHAAALVSFYRSDRNALLKTNVEGTANVVNAALEAGIGKFGFVSSTAAIGKGKQEEVVTEANPWDDQEETSNYAISKHYAEREVWRGSEEGLQVAIVNPCVVIGPGKWGHSSTTLFETIYRGMSFYTGGSNAFVDVRDVSQALIRLMDENVFGERFLVIAENLSYETLFTWIAEALERTPPRWKATPWMGAVAWRVETLKHWITGSPAKVTRETAQTAYRKTEYSHQKLLDQFPDFQFCSVEQAVQETARIFLNEQKK